MKEFFHCQIHGSVERYASTAGCRVCHKIKAKERKELKALGLWTPKTKRPIEMEPVKHQGNWLQCNHCGDIARNIHELWVHKRSHTGFVLEESSIVSSALGWM